MGGGDGAADQDASGRNQYPITPEKVGVGGVVLTLGVTLLIAGQGPGAGSAGAGAAAGPVSAEASLTVEQKARRSESRLRAKLRPSSETTVRAETSTDDCASVTYGRVRTFLEENPCRSVQRATLATELNGVGVVVPIAWVQMATTSSADALERLVREPGTGSVESLDQDVELTGQHFASRTEGEVVTLVEAEPTSVPLPDAVLDGAAETVAG